MLHIKLYRYRIAVHQWRYIRPITNRPLRLLIVRLRRNNSLWSAINHVVRMMAIVSRVVAGKKENDQ